MWLDHAQATKRRMSSAGEAPSLKSVVEENVLVQVDNLKTHPAVSAALRDDRVRLYAWVYHFESGEVTLYDPESRRYLPSGEVKGAIADDSSRFAL
jgi:carbonic anhydrase